MDAKNDTQDGDNNDNVTNNDYLGDDDQKRRRERERDSQGATGAAVEQREQRSSKSFSSSKPEFALSATGSGTRKRTGPTAKKAGTLCAGSDTTAEPVSRAKVATTAGSGRAEVSYLDRSACPTSKVSDVPVLYT